MTRTFEEYAKQKNLTQDIFPWYKMSKVTSIFKSLFIWLFIVAYIIKKIFNMKTLQEKLMQSLQYETLSKINLHIGRISKILFFLAFISVLANIWSYALRSRSFERDARANDKEARKLKNTIIRMANLNGKISRARQKLRNSNGGKDYNQEIELKAYEAISRMQIDIHTRQSLDDTSIKKLYKIRVPLPPQSDVEAKILNELKEYNTIATKACGGIIQFGQANLAADRSMIEFAEEIIVPDKYARVQEVKEVKEEYESTFPKTLFEDRSKERLAKMEAANKWGNNTAKSLDMILTTLGVQAIRKGLTVGSANVLVVYQMSFNLSIKDVNSLGDQLDNVLRTTGSAAYLDAGDLKIAIPTPKRLSLPIDVPSMYTEVFG